MEDAGGFSLYDIQWREEILPSDIKEIREIILSSGFFTKDETEIAAELVDERLLKGPASGYFFIFMEAAENLSAYTCFGPIPGTKSSFDLYWIAVRDDFRGQGLGRILLEKTEKKIESMGGSRIYIETSSRDQYIPTRNFYEAQGYRAEAVLKDFYSPSDDKIIYVKTLSIT